MANDNDRSMIPAPLAAALLPILRKQGASFAAKYLNERREKRRLSKRALEVRESLEPEILAELCPQPNAERTPTTAGRAVLPALLSGLLGAALGAAGYAFYQKSVRQ